MRLTNSVVEEWFAYPEDPDGAEFSIKMLSPGEKQEIFDATTRIESYWDAETQNSMRSRLNPGKDKRMTAIKSITGWRNVFDERGNEMKCTDRNKEKLLDKVPGFMEFILESRESLEAKHENKKKEAEKNL